MTQVNNNIGIVGKTITDILPVVNEGFNWELVKERFDPDPVGKAMSLHFTEDDGKEPIEEIYLGIAQGEGGEPRLVVLDSLGPNWEYLGSVVTYQDYGLKILDPDNPMTADEARYAHGGVKIQAGEGQSREKTWMVVSKVLDIMLKSHVYSDSGEGDE